MLFQAIFVPYIEFHKSPSNKVVALHQNMPSATDIVGKSNRCFQTVM